ncbi:pathogenicity island protein [Leclercia adecarboxylata]|nr:pathogenicity island protein [Leclercia adecarboxylata]KMN61122.1 pathogenicity island protein [Leclercia sp. LK8]
MFDKLKKISTVELLHLSPDGAIILMKLDGRMARGYLCKLSLVLAIFIDSIDNFPLEIAKYITLLLAACPEIHDHALQLIPDGGWLCCYYDKNMSTEKIAVEIEKHLALTRYLENIIVSKKSKK